uniref:hypothetical protein n=1 Tax=uncultured Draconibacterium sp. TaxID=1573823 RepID=UPI00321680CB
MKKTLSFYLAVILLFTACKPFENSLVLAPTSTPVVRENITFSYSADQIRHSDNHLKKRWANRNNVQVLKVNIINNTSEPIHGSQLRFYTDDKLLEIADNKLASEKLKIKKFPTAVYVVPIVFVGIVILAALASITEDDTYEDEFTDNSLPDIHKSDEAKDPLYKANLLQKGLYNFNIAQKTINPEEQISGYIAFKSKKEITNLDIRIANVDYKVVGAY